MKETRGGGGSKRKDGNGGGTWVKDYMNELYPCLIWTHINGSYYRSRN